MNLVVFGAQWGDEGKGKVVSYFSQFFDVVARFQGGSNAGHTVIRRDKLNKFSIIPCGIIEDHITCVIGCGVVLDIGILIKEIEMLKAQGFKLDNLMISDSISVVLPIHKELDLLYESKRKNKIGTTGRGVGLCYEDRVGRRVVRLCDVLHDDWRHIIGDLAHVYEPVLGDSFNAKKQETIDEIEKYAPELRQYTVNNLEILNKCASGKTLFEGSQGFWLDIYHGTYPYVTSSSTLPAQACQGTPATPESLGRSIGVAKAYATRVGNGPMPTEQQNEIGERITEIGKEYGTVTGRRRRCGWFDAVMVRQALKISGASALIITKLDVLDSFDKLMICGHYNLNNKPVKYFPASRYEQEALEPRYIEMAGWKSSTYGITDINKLPENAYNYIKKIEELVETPVIMLSTTPASEDMLVFNENLFNKIIG